MDGKPSTSALKALGSHANQDTSRQRDRFGGGSGGGGAQAGGSSFRTLPGSSSRQLPQQQAFDLAPLGQALPSPAGQQQQPWKADYQQQQHIQQPSFSPTGVPSSMNAQWARATATPLQHHQQQQQSAALGGAQWAEGFAQSQQQHFESQGQAGPIISQHQQAPQFLQPAYQPAFGMGGGMGILGVGASMYTPPMVGQSQQHSLEAGGKGKARADEAWETAFGAFDEARPAPAETEQPKGTPAGPEAFERAWAEAHPQPTADAQQTAPPADIASWEAQFSQFANGSAGLDDAEAEEVYREMMADQAEEIARGEAESAAEGLQGSVDDRGWPRLGPYAFESTNPYAEAGRARINEPPSSLSDRALFLEAALQEQQQAASSSTASVQARLAEAGSWLDLGETQTQDEKELAGMRALEAARQAYEGVLSLGSELNAQDRAEAERGLGRTLISLAVSYTNEAYDEAAYQTLHRHLELLHPAESRPLPAAPAGGVVANPWEMHAVLTEAYLDVVRAEMARGTVVPESQMALGLLNYSQGEFDRSADCWGAALTVRPDDFLLWNRLGATLANGGKPEEAIDAYRRALELNPSFTRAVYNLGVSCLNIGIFKEAAEHLLSALTLHESASAGGGDRQAAGLTTRAEAVNQSLNLWATLRRALYSMDRPDLAEKAVVGADLSQFRADFDF